MLKHLLLITLLLNTKTTEKNTLSIYKKFPSIAYTSYELEEQLNKGPVEINYVSVGCFSKKRYKLCLDKNGNDYSVELSMPSNRDVVFNDYYELEKEVKYYDTYLVSPEKLQELKSSLLANLEANSTTSHHWTIKSIDDSLSFMDLSGKDDLERFIKSLRK